AGGASGAARGAARRPGRHRPRDAGGPDGRGGTVSGEAPSGHPVVPDAVVLDGGSLTIEDLARIARDPRVRLEIAEEALARVRAGREQIERLTARYRDDFDRFRRGEDVRPVFEYGVT